MTDQPLSTRHLQALEAAMRRDTTALEAFTGPTLSSLVGRRLLTRARAKSEHRITSDGVAALTTATQPPGRALMAQRADGWDNPRDETRDPEPYDPTMDRYAVGTNARDKK